MTIPNMRRIVAGLLLAMSTLTTSIPFNNLFNPYDVLLVKPIKHDRCFELDITYENAYKSRGYQTDPEDRFPFDRSQEEIHAFSRQANVLQLWQHNQSFTGTLRGTTQDSIEDIKAFQFNTKLENVHDDLLVTGHLDVPVNLMMAARFALPYNVVFGLYLPFYVMELKDIRWRKHNTQEGESFENRIDQPLELLEEISDIDLRHGWKRHGIGDLAALLWWTHCYPQAKEWLKEVTGSMRGGLIFPTGTKADANILFGLPFGNDGGVGLLSGGTLELGFGHVLKLGIDAEFQFFFGTRQRQRIKTDILQTDLIFPNQAFMHLDPGFLQHYTIYLKLADICGGLSGTLAYQHTRQHEDTLIANAAFFDPVIFNSAESLQDWTTHSMVAMLDYDFCRSSDSQFNPRLSLFAKFGFNGKRSIGFDTFGCQLSLSF